MASSQLLKLPPSARAYKVLRVSCGRHACKLPNISHGVQELLENVADPKQFGKRGEPLFFGQLLFLILIVFPPTFFKVELCQMIVLACS